VDDNLTSKKCHQLESAQSADIGSSKKTSSAKCVSRENENHSEAGLLTIAENDQKDLKWDEAEKPLSPQMIKVLQHIALEGCDIDKLIKEKKINRAVIGRWIRGNKTFRSVWNDIVKSTISSYKADATSILGKSLDNISNKIMAAGIEDSIKAGKFVKSIIDDEVDPDDVPVKATKITEYDSDGKVMSETEQIEVVRNIRRKRGIIDEEDN
jgi:hypothetical protein